MYRPTFVQNMHAHCWSPKVGLDLDPLSYSPALWVMMLGALSLNKALNWNAKKGIADMTDVATLVQFDPLYPMKEDYQCN